MKYFVSYTTRDNILNESYLSQFYSKLKLFGEVYIDILHNNSSNKQERVFSELEISDILILIETESTYQSGWVRVEIESAIKKQIPIKRISFNDFILFINKDNSILNLSDFSYSTFLNSKSTI